MEPKKKYNRIVNITKKKQTHRYKLAFTSGESEGGRDNLGVRD